MVPLTGPAYGYPYWSLLTGPPFWFSLLFWIYARWTALRDYCNVLYCTILYYTILHILHYFIGRRMKVKTLSHLEPDVKVFLSSVRFRYVVREWLFQQTHFSWELIKKAGALPPPPPSAPFRLFVNWDEFIYLTQIELPTKTSDFWWVWDSIVEGRAGCLLMSAFSTRIEVLRSNFHPDQQSLLSCRSFLSQRLCY